MLNLNYGYLTKKIKKNMLRLLLICLIIGILYQVFYKVYKNISENKHVKFFRRLVKKGDEVYFKCHLYTFNATILDENSKSDGEWVTIKMDIRKDSIYEGHNINSLNNI